MVKVLKYDCGKGKVSRTTIRAVVKSVVADKGGLKTHTLVKPAPKKQKKV